MRLDTILGTQYPFIQGGMANIATGEFAAAVSNSGALGLIGAGGMDAETLRSHIRRCRQLTDKPFGVNIMLMNPAAPEMAKIVVEEQVAVVTTGAGNPGAYVPMWKEAGIKVFPVVAAPILADPAEPRIPLPGGGADGWDFSYWDRPGVPVHGVKLQEPSPLLPTGRAHILEGYIAMKKEES